MSHHMVEDRLQDYADNTLAGPDRVAVEEHLALCDACRAELDALRSMLARLNGLPAELQPAEDLRPAIWARIDAQPAPVMPVRPRLGERTLSSTRWWLAAAAVTLVAVSSAITATLAAKRAAMNPPVAGGLTVSPDHALTAVLAVEARYVAATRELQQLIDEQPGELSPETIRLLEENLLIIDRALAEARGALAGDPGNANLSRMLMATWEKKLGLLRTATLGQVGI